MSPSLFKLLETGYFPRELPPPFTTQQFALVVTNSQHTLPKGFSDKKKTALQCRHEIPSIGLRTRTTGIPNPILHYHLCSNVVTHWNILEAHYQASQYSKSKPIANPSHGRAIIPYLKQEELNPARARLRSLSKYILKADISRFYSSIYSHSIPWALHTKSVAKKRRQDLLLEGNILDRSIRNSQDGQTIGIPIGPDSSFAVAEIILSALDKLLYSIKPDLRVIRYVDDFELGFSSYADAEESLSFLKISLREFELELNSEKTRIIELPVPIEDPWVVRLKNYQFRPTVIGQASDLRAYFDLTFQLTSEYPTGHILKYAIQRLSSLHIHKNNWMLAESFLFQCLMVETNTFYPVVRALKRAEENNLTISIDDLQEIMNHQIIECATVNRGNEVANAIWALINWTRSINSNAAQSISKMDDPIVALTALDARERGLIPNGLDTTKWEAYLSTDELYSSNWLLAYEANVKNWLPSAHDYVAADPNFSFLKRNNVAFYDKTRATNVNITGASNSNLTVPLFSF